MSFDNDYPNRKDRRRPYYGSKAFDRTCRNHGGCPWCERNRTHKNKRRDPVSIPSPEPVDDYGREYAIAPWAFDDND